ncbi:MAG: hypothetical protein HC903_10700 [Methylacidiphilales bacterium]|nr:hypothetical protein [Candidatus Methylacidiphilales bacterium]NJR17199.1 hypothetical protein [Calothrix sp. CSU_2_0]
MKALTIELATGEIGRRSGVGLCGLDYLGSQPQILMPVQTHRPTSEAMPQVRQFFVILLDEEDSRHTPSPFIKIRFHFGDAFVVDLYKSIYPKLFKI